MSDRILLGATYGDEATGFIGVAIAHTDYLGGASRTQLQQRIERPGQRPVTEWFDDARLARLPAIAPIQTPAVSTLVPTGAAA